MRVFRRTPLAAVLLTALAAPALAGDVTVKVGHNHLDPLEVTVGVGDTVTWVNQDAMPGGHSVAATDGSFESPGLGMGESWSHTFQKPGRYRYVLQEHPSAQGTVIVE